LPVAKPHSARRRLDVHVENAGIFFASRTRHHKGPVGFVGQLVVTKAHVAVDPEEAAFLRAFEIEGPELWGLLKSFDQHTRSLLKDSLIEGFVFFVPFFFLIALDASEELQSFVGIKFCHLGIRNQLQSSETLDEVVLFEAHPNHVKERDLRPKTQATRARLRAPFVNRMGCK
jgi:hypothetical protein